MHTRQKSVDVENSNFWNELCGTQLAKSIGIDDASPASLRKFDACYMALYPYLEKHIPFRSLKGKKVLEIGLGYGTVAEKLASAGADYSGLDIAEGPVSLVNQRLPRSNLAGRAEQGSVLAVPSASDQFDYVISIGCLHHTGNLQCAIEECKRVLRKDGVMILMVYNAYSYRRWLWATRATWEYHREEQSGYRGVVAARTPKERLAYDRNDEGHPAPHTDWISVESLRSLCTGFRNFRATLENAESEGPFSMVSRLTLLHSPLPALAGLDIYASAEK